MVRPSNKEELMLLIADKVKSTHEGSFWKAAQYLWKRSEPLRLSGLLRQLTDGRSAVFGPTVQDKCQKQMSDFSHAGKEM